MILLSDEEKKFLRALGILSGLCLVLFVARVLATGTWHFLFVPENLILAWLALIFGWLLTLQLETRRWLSWQNLALTGLWLVFLPNTWYVLTDFIHVYPTSEISQLFDETLVGSLVISGFVLGFTSLYLVHSELRQRLTAMNSTVLILLVILLSSFAIYLGRDLRWNTWDILADPSGIVINASDRVLDPLGNTRALNVTGLFFVLISSMYLAFLSFVGLKPRRHRA